METLPAKFLTTKEVAKKLNVTERTVARWIDEGKIPVIRLGRSVRIDPRDLAEVLEKNKARRGAAEVKTA